MTLIMAHYVKYAARCDATAPEGIAAEVVCTQLPNRESGICDSFEEVRFGIQTNMIPLAEQSPALGFGRGGCIFDRIFQVSHYRYHQNSPALGFEDPMQFAHGGIIVNYMLKHVGADERVAETIRVRIHVGNVDLIVSGHRSEVSGSISVPT